jgi:hypothetical protein
VSDAGSRRNTEKRAEPLYTLRSGSARFPVLQIISAAISPSLWCLFPVFREPRPTKLAEPSSDERELIPTGPSGEIGCRDGFPADTVPVGTASRVASPADILFYKRLCVAAPEPGAR